MNKKRTGLSSPVLFQVFSEILFGEGERDRNSGVTRLHLAELPAAHSVLDFAVKFAVTGRRRSNGNADDFATRSDRELQGNLTLESRFLLQELVVDVAETRSTLTHNLHDVRSGTRSTTGTHVDIAFRRGLDRTLGLGSDTTATTTEKDSETVTDENAAEIFSGCDGMIVPGGFGDHLRRNLR